MHITPTLTPAAMERWALMTDHGKELILSSIWCGSCKTGRGIRDAIGEHHLFHQAWRLLGHSRFDGKAYLRRPRGDDNQSGEV